MNVTCPTFKGPIWWLNKSVNSGAILFTKPLTQMNQDLESWLQIQEDRDLSKRTSKIVCHI